MRIPPPLPMNPSDVTSSGKVFSQFFSQSNFLKPEVGWTSSKNYGHCSYNSNENIYQIFPAVSEQPSSCKVYVLGTAEQFKEMSTKYITGYFYDSFLMRS